MKKSPNEFSFWEHLEELRGRLIKCLWAILAGAVFAYIFIDVFFTMLIKPIGKLVFTCPSDAFTAKMNVALLGGVFFAFPVILYQFWRFVSVSLSDQEKRYILFYGPCSLILFLLGSLFAYFVMVPMAVKFLLSYSTDYLVPMITVKEYISFCLSLLLAFGIVFLLPLILMFLTSIGIATPEFLAQKRRHAIVLILIVSAILTPPDAASQLMMAAPLLALYEIGIVMSRLSYGSHTFKKESL